MDVTKDELQSARDRYEAATLEYAAAGQARLELFGAAVAAGWNSLEAAGALGITGLYINAAQPESPAPSHSGSAA